MKLHTSFYQKKNVVNVAKDLLGKYLFTSIGGDVTGGMIVETEAYSHAERGSHAFKGKTPRNQVMFEPGGVSYVYLCYGIHHMFNVVTNGKDIAEAVLVRALEPKVGEEFMLQRMKATSMARITSGPGKLAKALGIDRNFNGKQLSDNEIWIEEGDPVRKGNIMASPRIGIDYAGKDALLPWRFTIKNNLWVSKP